MNDRTLTPFIVAPGLSGGGAAGHAARDALRGAVVAIGNFDGVHRGHRAAIDTACARARALRRPAAVLTFEPHPRSFLKPQAPLFRLSDPSGKLRLLARTGLDGAIVLDFDTHLATLTAEAFVADILVGAFAVSGAVIGRNFLFGSNRTGTPDYLIAQGARRGFAVDIVPPFTLDGRMVSSGAIRTALEQGDLPTATAMLGAPWFVTGEVIHGDKRGRDLGYPTANIRLAPDCALRHGIYAVRIGIDGAWHAGVASFGRRPTFDNGAALLEIHLFDFAADLYGRRLDIAFIGYIRDELKFDSIETLIAQMDRDSAEARAILDRQPEAVPLLAAPGEITAAI